MADRFAKFTILADPAPLWRRAAEELAQHAAQVRGIPANSFVPSIHDMLTLTATAIDKDPLLRSLVRRVVIADAMPVREPPCSLSSC